MGRQRFVDILVMLLAVLLGTATTATTLPALREPYDLAGFAVLLAGAGALLFRRQAPVAVAWFVAATGVVFVLAVLVWPGLAPGVRLPPESTLLPAAAPFAAYAVAAHGERTPRAWLPFAVIVVVACVGAPPGSRVVAVVGAVLTLVGGPAAVGAFVAARAERAERARQQERLRLAAEIHDVVSHRVSVMVLQAGALHLTAPDEPTRQAAMELRTTGCQALDELRDLVELLSTADEYAGPLEPLPDLSDLVAAATSVGLAVTVGTTGKPGLLSPAVARAAYRVVQEALTNVGKHAPGARVRVEVRHLPDGVRVRVHNTAPARATDERLTAAGGGTGLLGLRRRVELLGGTLLAEPVDRGGFEVAASLPSGGQP